MFSFEYYNMVCMIKYQLKDMPVPDQIIKCNNIQYWLWIILSVVTAFCYQICIIIENSKTYEHIPLSPEMTISSAILGGSALLVASIVGGYLAYAIYQIRKIILEQNSNFLNTKILLIHITSFTLSFLANMIKMGAY